MKTFNNTEFDIKGILPNGNEGCVICGEDSGVDAMIPIELRNFYIRGQGQLCLRCAGKTGLIEFPPGVVKKDDPWTGQTVKV